MSAKKTAVAAASKSSKPSNKTTVKAKTVGALTAALDAPATSAPAAPVTTDAKLDSKGVRYPTAAEINVFNAAAKTQCLRDIMPGLVAKHGTSNPSPVEGKKYIVDPRCEKDYTNAKAEVLRDMVSRAGLSLNRAPMIDISAEEMDAMSKIEEVKTTPEGAAAAKPSKSKHESIVTTHGEFRKGSVLHAIYRAFELKGGATKQEILERLVKEFPARTAEDMASTVNTQINRMPKEREFTLGRSDLGRYGLHIEGVSKVRILSPEAAEKQAKRTAEKEAKDAQAKLDKEKAKADKAAADLLAAQEAAKKSGITVNVPGAQVVGQAAPAAAGGKKKK